MNEVVRDRGLGAFGGGKAATGGKSHLLEGSEVVFALGKAQSKRYVRIARPDYVRHAEGVAFDANIILMGFGNQGRPIRRRRLLQAIGDHEEQKNGDEQT